MKHPSNAPLQAQIFRLLVEVGPMPEAELARRLGRRCVAKQVHALERSGFVRGIRECCDRCGSPRIFYSMHPDADTRPGFRDLIPAAPSKGGTEARDGDRSIPPMSWSPSLGFLVQPVPEADIGEVIERSNVIGFVRSGAAR